MQELKIGLVGTGAIGRTHIERINHKLSGAKVIACADANKEFCKSVAEKYGLQAYISDAPIAYSSFAVAIVYLPRSPKNRDTPESIVIAISS